MVLALKVQSVQALWFFTSDLVFVLLFPQLVFALFDPPANAVGSGRASRCRWRCAWAAASRSSGLPPLIPYPELFAWLLCPAIPGRG